MDPTVAVAAIASVGAIVVAIIQGRNSTTLIRSEDRARRLERRLIDHHGEDPDDVANL